MCFKYIPKIHIKITKKRQNRKKMFGMILTNPQAVTIRKSSFASVLNATDGYISILFMQNHKFICVKSLNTIMF